MKIISGGLLAEIRRQCLLSDQKLASEFITIAGSGPTAEIEKRTRLLQPQQTMSDPLTPTQRYVRENRDELMQILKHGDQTIRVLAIAVLLDGGTRTDIQDVKRELELMDQIDDWDELDPT